ncbi:MAG: DoxX family membrane protein [bacterium]
MKNMSPVFERLEVNITNRLARSGIVFLRVSVGIVFFWFGALKFFPGLSPAQDLATRTINILTFGLIPPDVSILLLATWECLIGIGMILNVFMRTTLFLMFLQMLGTFTPLIFFPQEVFTRIPYAPTLEGQYIIKNIVIVSAGLVIGATVRGGGVVADPDIVQKSGQRT